MPAQVVVLQRSERPLFALVRAFPAWLRALWVTLRVGREKVGTRRGMTPSGLVRERPLETDPPTDRIQLEAQLKSVASGCGGPEEMIVGTQASVAPERAKGLFVGLSSRRFAPFIEGLRADPDFRQLRLLDLCVVDAGPAAGRERFRVVYDLDLPERNFGVSMVVRLDPAVPGEAGSKGDPVEQGTPDDGDPDERAPSPVLESVSSWWPAALAFEREAFDLFGIRFRGHPDLTRILLPPGYVGAPLRKDASETGSGSSGALGTLGAAGGVLPGEVH